MSVTVAKSAGFCFGVNRAVELVEQSAASGKQVATLGPIIHNRHVVGKFEDMGVGFDEYVCCETHECKQVWDDGHVEIFEISE